MPLPMSRKEKGRRRAAGRVSGWRSANHAKGDRGDREERGENRAPASEPQDPLAEGRGNGGNEDEYGHHE